MSNAAAAAEGGAAALQVASIGMDSSMDVLYEDDVSDNSIPDIQKITKANNILHPWGNAVTMNLNALLLENIVSSSYFKSYLVEVTNFQQILEEIYYNVQHLEPWERGTRKTTGMTGMCGGVRGVGAGGVVSTAFCLLYKMFTLKLTRKQLVSLINHADSPYLRGMGFMYIRFCQPPADLWAWIEPYLDDEEEIDPRSGAGDLMTIGNVCKLMLTKLDWYGTLFPRIPVPIQKDIEAKFHERLARRRAEEEKKKPKEERHASRERSIDKTAAGSSRQARSRSPRDRDPKHPRTRSPVNRHTDDRSVGSRHERTRDERDKDGRRKHTGYYKCKHHLRHHHCKKHKRRCPTKAKKQDASSSSSSTNKPRSPRHSPSTRK
uniref:Pre-mRNA-splicing factor 38 n=1 Tax=Plectus sambesii TaxID=2011161 RepID=A0A914W808_9BILA